jgi:hypothetical protein
MLQDKQAKEEEGKEGDRPGQIRGQLAAFGSYGVAGGRCRRASARHRAFGLNYSLSFHTGMILVSRSPLSSLFSLSSLPRHGLTF